MALTVRLRGIFRRCFHDSFVGIGTCSMVQAIDDPGASPLWIYDHFSGFMPLAVLSLSKRGVDGSVEGSSQRSFLTLLD